MTHSSLLSKFAATIFLINCAYVFAETETKPSATAWYSIEYIVFENNPLSNQPLEVWSKEPFQMPIDAIDLEPLSRNKAFSSLNTNQQQLHGVYRRLEKLSSYTPIAHGGWIQPLKKKGKLNNVKITHQTGAHRLEGTLTFHRGRFLHLNVDLQFSEMFPLPINNGYVTNNVIQPATLYRLKETRRIKTSQSNYFDHPRFGVLAIVEKINPPNASTSSSQAVKEQQ
ncbi:MAG: CsiV family protein [Cycloclasticus sp.]|jgi:hypothetical protein|nr:CsiV family protein [Cycloclasticus sp.]